MSLRNALCASLLAATLPLLPSLAAAQDFAIIHATMATGDGSEPIDNASIVVKNGKITAIGKDVPIDAKSEVIDASGKWVAPGIFAAMTDLGLWDVGAVSQSNDKSASGSPFGAALDVTSGINPDSQHIRISRAGGVTRASVTSYPSGSLFGGQGAVIDLGDDPDAVFQPRAFQYVVLGEEGAKIAGGSRTASYVALKNALAEAGDLASRSGRKDDSMLTRPDAAALIPVIQGRQPVYIAVERASDIRSVIALKQEYPSLKIVLVGASEGWLVAEDIARSNIP
ncbi:MAG: amidohydrolase, partial [Sphingomonadaceae bacterium]